MGQKIQRENNKNKQIITEEKKKENHEPEQKQRKHQHAQREREMLHKLPESMETNKTITENRAETQTQIQFHALYKTMLKTRFAVKETIATRQV